MERKLLVSLRLEENLLTLYIYRPDRSGERGPEWSRSFHLCPIIRIEEGEVSSISPKTQLGSG